MVFFNTIEDIAIQICDSNYHKSYAKNEASEIHRLPINDRNANQNVWEIVKKLKHLLTKNIQRSPFNCNYFKDNYNMFFI